MLGVIRTDQKCPKCQQLFATTPQAITCHTCLTHPTTYYIDLHWKGKRYKIRRNAGYLIDSFQRASRLLEKIRSEIDEKQGSFNPTIYMRNYQEMYAFDNYIHKWLELVKPQLSLVTYHRKLSIINLHLLPYFKDIDIRGIKSYEISLFLEEISKKSLSRNYIISILKELHAALSQAFDWEILDRVPKFPILKEEEKPILWADRKTQMIILRQIPPRKRGIFRFLFVTGCRICEARALMWDKVDFNNHQITISRIFSRGELKEVDKTKKYRVLPMNDELFRLLSQQSRNLGFVFVNPDSHRPYSGNISKIWKRATQKINVDIPLYNSTRHSFFTQKLSLGADIKTLKEFAGHSRIETTERYAKLLSDKFLPLLNLKKKKVIPITKSVNRPDVITDK